MLKLWLTMQALDESRELLEVVLFHEVVIQSQVGEGDQVSAVRILLRFRILQNLVVSFPVEATESILAGHRNASIPRRIQHLHHSHAQIVNS